MAFGLLRLEFLEHV
jgi:bifunctional DNase/RNase